MNVSEKDEEGLYAFIKQNENPEVFPDNETECKLSTAYLIYY